MVHRFFFYEPILLRLSFPCLTRERNVIHFGSYFIYGGHFMDRDRERGSVLGVKTSPILSFCVG